MGWRSAWRSSGAAPRSLPAAAARPPAKQVVGVAGNRHLRIDPARRHACCGRHHHAGPAHWPDADVHLPDHPRRERRPARSRWSRTRCTCRSTPGRPARNRRSIMRSAPPAARRSSANGDKTVHDPAQDRPQVVERRTDRCQRRRLLDRPAEGGDQGEPRQLGSVLPGPDAAERNQHHDERASTTSSCS